MTVLLVVLAQAAAPSDAGDEQAKAKAQVLLKEGTAMFDGGDAEGALARFEAAYQLYPSPKLQFDIGQADRELGRPADAIAAFERFLALTRDPAPDLVSEAKSAIADLRSRVGQLNVKGGPAGADVAIDGKPVGKLPLARPVLVAPGRHVVRVQQAGYAPVTVTVSQAETQTIVLVATGPRPIRAEPPTGGGVLAAQVPAATSTEDRSESWWKRRGWFFWTAAGATVTFAAVATISGLAANSRFDELAASCGQTQAGCTESQIGSVKSRATVANVFGILTGASAVATGVSAFVQPGEAGLSLAWKW
jgi:hypothetical protein